MTTVAELYEKYQAVIMAGLSEGTARAYVAAWRTRVRDTFGAQHVEHLRALDIELGLAQWDCKPSTKRDGYSVLARICRVAVKGGQIAANPCASVDLPPVPEPFAASRALSPAEAVILIEELPESGPYRRFMLALLYSGCRIGEVAGLVVSDIDWERGVIRVARTASPGIGGKIATRQTKGKRERLVPISAPLAEVLREAEIGKGVHDLLFPGSRGGTITSRNLHRALNWAVIREKVKTFPPGEPPLRFHDLRHTAGVMLFLAQVPAPDVQAILGHSSLTVTQRYANTAADAAQRAAGALTNHFQANSLTGEGVTA